MSPLRCLVFTLVAATCHAGILPTMTSNDHKSRVVDLVSAHSPRYLSLPPPCRSSRSANRNTSPISITTRKSSTTPNTTTRRFSAPTKRRTSTSSRPRRARNAWGNDTQRVKRTPSSSRLLFDRIDKDHNGTISKQELKDWIRSVQMRYITDDVDRQWTQMNNDSNDAISWQEYDQTTYYALCKSRARVDGAARRSFRSVD